MIKIAPKTQASLRISQPCHPPSTVPNTKKKFEKNYVKLQVEVLLNDTLATLLAGSYGPATASVLVGVMLGTATNAVFQQRLDQIPTTSYHANTLEVYKTYFENTMIIDTEWGAFGESTGDLDTLRTEFDEVNANGISIVDSAFNELGYNEISEFFEHSLEPIFFLNKVEAGQFFFPWSLEFRQIGNLLYLHGPLSFIVHEQILARESPAQPSTIQMKGRSK